MDSIDRKLIPELAGNCRVSYHSLGRTLGLSASSARNRVLKIRDSGILSRGYVFLSLAMIDAEYCYALLTTDGTENDATFIDQLGTHSAVIAITRIGPQKLHVGAQVVGSRGLHELGEHFQKFDCIQDMDVQFMYPATPTLAPEQHQYVYLGKKVTFTKTQLAVLKHLWKDARMPATEISKLVSFTSRRVQQIIHELQNSGGLYFTTLTRWSAAGIVPFFINVDFDENKTKPHEVVQWVQKVAENVYWNAWLLPKEPRLMHFCTTNDIQTAESITSLVKEAPFAKKVECVLFRPQNFFVGPGYIRLGELLGEQVSNHRVEFYNNPSNQWY